jgi:hypothetical protein
MQKPAIPVFITIPIYPEMYSRWIHGHVVIPRDTIVVPPAGLDTFRSLE